MRAPVCVCVCVCVSVRVRACVLYFLPFAFTFPDSDEIVQPMAVERKTNIVDICGGDVGVVCLHLPASSYN